ncbi:hypothetical protein Ancab_013758 [Ancistrocladus abbreviatus]
MVGGVAVATTFTALVCTIRTKLARKKQESKEACPSAAHFPPASSSRDHSSGAPEERLQILDLDSPPKMPSHLPSIRHITKDTTSQRSFSRKIKMPPSAKLYTVAEVQLATNNFSEANLIGKGSLGSVYKAEFPDGQALEMAISNSGYRAPEHGQPGAENTTTDVCAFGVLLLELLTGQRPFDRQLDASSFPSWLQFVYLSTKTCPAMVFQFKAKERAISGEMGPEKEFRPFSGIVEALTGLIKKPGMDGSEDVDPFEKSFQSTQTRYAGSSRVSHFSV